MRTCRFYSVAALAVLLSISRVSAQTPEVLIYTGNTGWISKAAADVQAQICVDQLDALGIANSWAQDPGDIDAVADWVLDNTDDGDVDVLITYGWFPPTLYPEGNTQPDDSIAELFIESEDGDAIMNHADYIFYVSSVVNGEPGIQNIMDIPGLVMWDDNTPLTVTPEGAELVPSLSDFMSDRPFHIEQLVDDWFVEISFAQNAAGTRADPIVVRDGDRGRIIPVIQTADGNEPKGAIAAEIIAWLYDVSLSGGTKLVLSGREAGFLGEAIQLSVELQDDNGGRRPAAQTVTVSLATDAATGAFDTAADGSFDGSVTTVAIASGESVAGFYYKDSTVGDATITATAGGLEGAEHEISILDPDAPNAPAGEVAIYTGNSGWIAKTLADEQAQITVDALTDSDIGVDWFQSDLDQEAVAEWVQDHTGDGKLDVLITYGWFPPTIYPAGNAMPDDSIAELFIESEDGDAIINHADYMFYVSSTNNNAGGLQNMMDLPGITMWDDNTPLTVTAKGAEISPTLAAVLGDYLSDRPLHLNELSGKWYVEASLAENAAGTRADPVIVRNGDRGRLIPVIQTADGTEPKGAIAADIILWLYGVEVPPTQVGLVGPASMIEGKVARIEVQTQDLLGGPRPVASDATVSLETDSATGAFDTAEDGSFDGSVTSVVIAAGTRSATVYYKDTSDGMVTLTASAGGLDAGEHQMTSFPFIPAEPGEVAIYTGNTSWITKPLADEQAQITADMLEAEGIPTTLYPSDLDMEDLAAWVDGATDNGQFDVLILYGYVPSSIYPAGNAMIDDSIVELFVESTDGDAVINHADYMFYVSSTNNAEGGIRNVMDNPVIVMWDDNTPMTVTPEGAEIAPSLIDYMTDRPLHVNELEGDWTVEVSLAQNSTGTRADPIIVRDGNRGRLIPVIQTADGNEPKGAIAGEIITWMMEEFTESESEGASLLPGDVNGDGQFNISDPVAQLNFLFSGGLLPTCFVVAGTEPVVLTQVGLEILDFNGDGSSNIADGVGSLGFQFSSGPPPALGVDCVILAGDCESSCAN